MPRERHVSRVVASYFAEGTAYLALDRHRNDDPRPYLFRTTDHGATWKPLANDLPAGGPVLVVRESSRNPDLLFAGTEFGLFVTPDSPPMSIRSAPSPSSWAASATRWSRVRGSPSSENESGVALTIPISHGRPPSTRVPRAVWSARDGIITRVEVLGGKHLYAIQIHITGETFDLCPADICKNTKGEELTRIGYKGGEKAGAHKLAAMFELHIEQGPTLEAERRKIGVVQGVQGIRWYEITITGQDSHSGTTPMTLRSRIGSPASLPVCAPIPTASRSPARAATA